MVMHSMFSFLYKNKDWIFRDPEGAVKIPCVNGGEWERAMAMANIQQW